MHTHYHDYYWKDGLPYGLRAISKEIPSPDHSYTIVMDPYRKRVSIERYAHGIYVGPAYDSALLDFRHLRSAQHAAWRRIPLSESVDKVVCLIRDEDDRARFIETHHFQQGLCRECRVESVHGWFLSTHKMFYTTLQDPFNGVMLYDQNAHIVMFKQYNIDQTTGEFTELLKEEWDPRQALL